MQYNSLKGTSSFVIWHWNMNILLIETHWDCKFLFRLHDLWDMDHLSCICIPPNTKRSCSMTGALGCFRNLHNNMEINIRKKSQYMLIRLKYGWLGQRWEREHLDYISEELYGNQVREQFSSCASSHLIPRDSTRSIVFLLKVKPILRAVRSLVCKAQGLLSLLQSCSLGQGIQVVWLAHVFMPQNSYYQYAYYYCHYQYTL